MRRPLRGFIPVTVTPFAPGGDLMLDRFEALLEWYLDRGADGLCVGADNGESWALSTAELGRVVESAVRVAGGRVPVIGGAMGGETVSAADTLRRVEAVAAAGADAALVAPPAYLAGCAPAEVIARYEAVGRGAAIPLVAYDAPGHFRVTLDPGTLRSIQGVADVVALKASSRDFHHTGRIIHDFADRIDILVGPGWFIMPGIALGAHGFLSTGPDLLGADSARIVPLAQGAPSAESRRLHERVAQVYFAMLDGAPGTPPAPIKAALGLMGQDVGVPRPPVRPLDPDGVDRVARALAALGLIDGAQVGALSDR